MSGSPPPSLSSAATDQVVQDINQSLEILRNADASAISLANLQAVKDQLNLLINPQVMDDASGDSPKEDAAVKTPATVSPALSAAGAKKSPVSKIILSTYPGQAGVVPIPLNWGEQDPAKRGPVIVSRRRNTLKRRNGWFISIPFFFFSHLVYPVRNVSV